ncbi:hypothetical protein ACP26O_18055 [Burkholderia sp. R-40]|uniref:hypothetical protein n=1 Tax=Burkholderia TaxID=32008 RepID=UPI0015937678|nr:hypothetical protein [Burkholderia ambifaria]
MDKQIVITVSEQAVEKRLKRALAREGLTMHVSRSERQIAEFGRYYVSDTYTNRLEWSGSDLDAWAREMGVLKAHEQISYPQ